MTIQHLLKSTLSSIAVIAACGLVPLAAQNAANAPQASREKRLSRDEAEILEKNFKVALLVGIGDYDRELTGLSELRYPVGDIRAVAAELKLQGYTPIMMTDRLATAAQIRQRLKDLADMVEPGKGTVLFYFSGHGFRIGDTNYLATYNTTMEDMAQQGLALTEVQKLLAATGARQRVAFIDACRNDPNAKSASGRPFDQLQEAEGLRILYSTAPGKVSYEDDALQHGVFSYFVARGLHGEAAGPDGMVTFDDLKTWVTDRMRAYGAENQKAQIPYQLGESTGDFLLARKPPEDVASVAETAPAIKPPSPLGEAAATQPLAQSGSSPDASGKRPVTSDKKDNKSKPLTVASAELTASASSDDPPTRVARLSLTDGTVSLQPAGLDEWTAAEINRPITTGDHLWVDDIGHAEVQIGSGVLRLSEKTSFSFLNLDDHTTQVKLVQGTLSVRLRRIDKGETVEVDTPNTAISLVSAGDYRFQVSETGDNTVVAVNSGLAEGVAGAKTFAVQPNQSITVAGIESPTWTAASMAPREPDRYFAARDRRQEKSVASSYVAEDMVGAEDLDDNGTWRPVRGYGMGWMPNDVPAGWEPYRDGHWAWIDPWGWTWVDDAPWGFAPFHYGRWMLRDGGWTWLPGGGGIRAAYAPAMVAWAGMPSGGGGAGVGWFPLGPGEVYVPGYRASARYANRINVTSVNITNIRVTSVNVSRATYSNRFHATVVSRDVFIGARPVSARTMLRLSPSDLAQSRIASTAGEAPQKNSLLATRSTGVAALSPPTALLNRSVVVRSVPPPARVPFSQEERLLANSQGRPVPASDLSRVQPPSKRADVRTAELGIPAPNHGTARHETPGAVDSKDQARLLKQQQEEQKRAAKAQQEQQKREQKLASEKQRKDEIAAKQSQRAAQDKQKRDEASARAAQKSAQEKLKRDQVASRQAQKAADERRKHEQATAREAQKTTQQRQRRDQVTSTETASKNKPQNPPSAVKRQVQPTVSRTPQPRQQQTTPSGQPQTPPRKQQQTTQQTAQPRQPAAQPTPRQAAPKTTPTPKATPPPPKAPPPVNKAG